MDLTERREWAKRTFSETTGLISAEKSGILNNILITVLGNVDMLHKFSVCVWYIHCRQRNEMVHFFMLHPVLLQN